VKYLVTLAPALLLALVAGCGPGSGRVTGKVLYKDQPVTSGRVVFEGAGRVESGDITSDGTYRIESAPVGDVKIGVITERPFTPPSGNQVEAGKSARKGPPTQTGVVVPDKYRNTATSGLTYTVGPGEQEHDIVLK
jgi:hypothetical protein